MTTSNRNWLASPMGVSTAPRWPAPSLSVESLPAMNMSAGRLTRTENIMDASSAHRLGVNMTARFRLPDALQTQNDQTALDYLRCYYEKRPGTALGTRITGARFDSWDSARTRDADKDRFTADDLIAVSFLSAQVPPKAAWELLAGDPERFNQLLANVDSDTDLTEVRPADIDENWPAWKLWDPVADAPRCRLGDRRKASGKKATPAHPCL